ncbi:hypothetical protein NEMBOFW57_010281 [Staphylotrichum longicolle]|uniref:Uncharacterized protein n=1 Tax=Staphylotrichum longicolle TaxID=669026 RepID=A0AAD4HWV8_9PEZI|nr:hypothetical protein NEMBOFW57_010281 [Staphylotrichum longicolle]
MAPPTIVLITGANRGIGRGLLELYLARPNHVVVAAVRDPNHATAKELSGLPKAQGTSLVVIKLDLTVHSDPTAAVEALSASHGIKHVDILVANAGIATKWVTVSEVTPEDIQDHVDVNVHGNFIPMKNAAYAPTKLVQHWLTKAIHTEEPWLTAFPVDPGWVQTDLGQRGADAFGFEKAAITVDESVNGIIKVIDASPGRRTAASLGCTRVRNHPADYQVVCCKLEDNGK